MSDNNNKPSKAGSGLVLIILVLGFGVAILWSNIKVTWVDGDMWRAQAEKMSKNYIDRKANRGNIYSSDGKILATTVPECDLYIDFGRYPLKDKNGRIKHDSKGDTIFYTPIHDTNYRNHVDEVCKILHEACPDSSAASFKAKFEKERKAKKPRGCVLFMRHISYSDWDRICKLRGWNHGVVKYVGGKSVIHNVRSHTYNNMGESVVGFSSSYLSENYNGLDGYYDSVLRGHDGRLLCRRLTRGSWIPINNESTIVASDSIYTDSVPGYPVINGQDIMSTIDTRLQDIAHYSLERSLRRYGSKAGCAILLEVETGNVLVCSSLILDTNGNYRESPYRNVAVSDLYEPGSIFKPVLLTAMYNDPSFALDTSMLLPVGRKKFSASSAMVEDHGIANGNYPLWKAVAVSSNVAFCELAWRYYNNRRDSLFAQVSRIFPFQKLDVDMIAKEYKSRTNPLNNDNDFLRFCYGYTIATSPLRMATFYNALANKGRMVKPRFCKAIKVNGIYEELPVQVINEQICSQQTAETLRDLLIGVVEGGTGDNIKNDTYLIAGKTGTAVTSPKAVTSNATFVGFFPADKPKYTCLVMMEDIKMFGRNAAPVFQDIADCVVSLDKDLDCRPTMRKRAELLGTNNTILANPTTAKTKQAELRHVYNILGIDKKQITMNSDWCELNTADDGSEEGYGSYEIRKGVIPNCYGMTIKDALLLCRSLGIDVTFEGYGKVYSQEPKARTPITSKGKVHLKLRTKK